MKLYVSLYGSFGKSSLINSVYIYTNLYEVSCLKEKVAKTSIYYNTFFSLYYS